MFFRARTASVDVPGGCDGVAQRASVRTSSWPIAVDRVTLLCLRSVSQERANPTTMWRCGGTCPRRGGLGGKREGRQKADICPHALSKGQGSVGSGRAASAPQGRPVGAGEGPSSVCLSHGVVCSMSVCYSPEETDLMLVSVIDKKGRSVH